MTGASPLVAPSSLKLGALTATTSILPVQAVQAGVPHVGALFRTGAARFFRARDAAGL